MASLKLRKAFIRGGGGKGGEERRWGGGCVGLGKGKGLGRQWCIVGFGRKERMKERKGSVWNLLREWECCRFGVRGVLMMVR